MADSDRITRLEVSIEHLTRAVENLTKHVDSLSERMAQLKGMGFMSLLIGGGLLFIVTDTFKRVWGMR